MHAQMAWKPPVGAPRPFSAGLSSGGCYAPWHFLYFLPEPHQQGSLRPILSRSALTTVSGFSPEPPLPPEAAGVPTAAAPAAGAVPWAIAACEASAIADGCSGPPPA